MVSRVKQGGVGWLSYRSAMTPDRPFRVVTHKNWLAEQFAPLGAVQDFGFDIDPGTARETLWWAPGAWVASAYAAGVTLPLMSCGPRWLDGLPEKYTGRAVATLTVEQAIRLAPNFDEKFERFVKLPEAKLDRFPARLHEVNRHWGDTLGQYQLPPDALIQLQMPMDFVVEARFWIAHGEITTTSPYRFGPTVWGEPGFSGAPEYLPGDGTAMRKLALEVIANVETPPGFVLDVGVTTDNEAWVVEANASWSSGPYDGDPAGILKSIEAAHDFTGAHPEWAWQPQPALHNAGPLKVVRRVCP